jgi:hypothetical protein
MVALLETRNGIRAHWRTAASQLGAALPLTGGNYFAQYNSSEYVASLGCNNHPNEVALREGGLAVPVVPLLHSTSDDSIDYWLGWHEQWRVPTSGSTRRLQFKFSAVTVYWGPKGVSKRQLIRAEWAGADGYDQTRERDVFPADGSAHPHWHIDGFRTQLEELRRQIDEVVNEHELKRELAEEQIREFGERESESAIVSLFDLPSIRLPSNSELAWTRIHLATNASWSSNLWSGPDGPHDTHAQNPNSVAEIRNWLMSCVRYLQSQIEKEIHRARWLMTSATR